MSEDLKQIPGEETSTSADSRGSLPAISLPKSGGAIQGMGEKFGANPVTGSGTLTIPIPTTPSRSGFFPQFTLSYSSGDANGPFGLGWGLSAASVSRKTEKELPRYADGEESDTFVLADMEDLVPVLVPSGNTWVLDQFAATVNAQPYTVKRYRPRVEDNFSRIERWENDTDGTLFWKSVSKQNVTSIFGRSESCRIFDPEDKTRVFKWLLELSYDDKGSLAVYDYKQEDFEGVADSAAERNRQFASNRYLKHVRYGFETPYYPDDQAPAAAPLPTDWLFQLVFDYGEHDATTPDLSEPNKWVARPDAFSSYKAGFEIRTYRLCQRALLFHQFPELGNTPCLVRSTDFQYARNPVASFLTSAEQTGYIRNPGDGTYSLKDAKSGAILSPLSLPPLELTYTSAIIDSTIHEVEERFRENLPGGVDGNQYRWLDLDSEGSPGVLSAQAGVWFYKRNVSNVPRGTNGAIVFDEDQASGTFGVCFDPVEVVGREPAAAITEGRQAFLDIAGDGRQSLVQYRRPDAGFYEREKDNNWKAFVPFASSPIVNWDDPNLRFVDLDGDGLPDILITEHEVFTWHASEGPEGFGRAQRVAKPFDEEHGPAIVFADATQSIYLADFSGDGLTDIVRIRNGEVCYWPNLGYGRFGAKITMENAPVFDSSDDFEQNRIRLADTDGSGTTDILYLGRNGTTLWFNQSGNSWSAGQTLPQLPESNNVDSVAVVDLMGNGTACLVWSSPLPGDSSSPLRYIDLMGGQKPHLLVSVKNNLGAETRVRYAASTKFYLLDRAAGQPWITRLGFPVHVVERTETFDYVSKTKRVSKYRYHHGFYDGVEREFRGFGMVEQLDSESLSKFSGTGLFSETPDVEGEEFHLPPVRTKSWFHTGIFFSRENILRFYESEYFQGDAQAVALPDMDLPGTLTGDEIREACRALKGKLLREEVYSEDGTPEASCPHTATDYSYQLRLLQPKGDQKYACFYANQSEALAYHYERNPTDPRVVHDLTLAVDDFGNVVKGAVVAYPRRVPQGGPAWPTEQSQLLMTYAEADVANEAGHADWYRIGFPVESRTFELTGIVPVNANGVFSATELFSKAMGATQIAFEASPDGSPQKRLLSRARTIYRRNDLSGPLSTGVMESLALPYASYRAAFTTGLLNAYTPKIPSAALVSILAGDGGYQNLDGDGVWWIPSAQLIYSADPAHPDANFARGHFYLPQGSLDAFGGLSTFQYDSHNLAVQQTNDPLNNAVKGQYNYRSVSIWFVTDANLNRSGARFDALGRVTASAVMGKEGAGEGDILDLGTTEASAADDPTTRTEYASQNWWKNGLPNSVHTFAREQHGAANLRWQESYAYSDGLGRTAMTKTQAEPGLAPARDANGVLQFDGSGKLIFAVTSSRWIGTGRTVYDNKGHAIKKYEPFFDSTFAYEDEKELVNWGVTPILRYDPLGRVIRTDQPNGTFQSKEYDAWQQVNSDENDTVLASKWYADLGSPDPLGAEPADEQTRAAWLAAKHANTPSILQLDPLARMFLTVDDNGSAGKFETRSQLDIQGRQLSLTDALGRKVMTYDYQMTGAKIHQSSVDGGERWLLQDVAGNLLRGWDSRDHQTRQSYDALRRPIETFVKTGNGAEILVEQAIYGESQANAEAANLRTRLYQKFDSAGADTTALCDFKGNLVTGKRQLLSDYHQTADWSQSPALDAAVYAHSAAYDALNRPVSATLPDGSVVRPTYNESNLVKQLNANLGGAAVATAFVNNIDYNARGQREKIEYANGATTAYAYDTETFRLNTLKTTRLKDNADLQDLIYIYDPVGNITAISDNAQQTVYFSNQVVSPNARYAYDALYQLTFAAGREHRGQLAQPQVTWDDTPRMNQPQPTEGQAMRNYTESYSYDGVGNLIQLLHQAVNGTWSRTFFYDEPHASPTNNHLTSSKVGLTTESFTFDPHGNVTSMSHLPMIGWDFLDQLQTLDLGGGGTVYYVYDSSGQRVRKVIERQGGVIEQRIYLGAFEIFEKTSNGAVVQKTETVHILDGSRKLAIVETRLIDSAVAAASLPSTVERYQFTNQIGCTCLELDETAQLISYEEYFPFGSTSFQQVNSAIPVSLKRYRYTGKERDDESGLYYNHARYYLPWVGRWSSADPAGMKDGVNLYRYAHNNPIRIFDPSGTQGVDTQAKPSDKPADPADGSDIDLKPNPEFANDPVYMAKLRVIEAEYRLKLFELKVEFEKKMQELEDLKRKIQEDYDAAIQAAIEKEKAKHPFPKEEAADEANKELLARDQANIDANRPDPLSESNFNITQSADEPEGRTTFELVPGYGFGTQNQAGFTAFGRHSWKHLSLGLSDTSSFSSDTKSTFGSGVAHFWGNLYKDKIKLGGYLSAGGGALWSSSGTTGLGGGSGVLAGTFDLGRFQIDVNGTLLGANALQLNDPMSTMLRGGVFGAGGSADLTLKLDKELKGYSALMLEGIYTHLWGLGDPKASVNRAGFGFGGYHNFLLPEGHIFFLGGYLGMIWEMGSITPKGMPSTDYGARLSGSLNAVLGYSF
jgi:RHS repeat-associated protein